MTPSATAVGIALMLVSTTINNIGAVLQKMAVDRLPRFSDQPWWSSVRAIAGSRLWLFGWSIAVLALALNMIALGYADLGVIQPLNGFGLVVLAICSRLLLGETLGLLGAGGIAVIGCGVTWIGALAPASRVFTSAGEILGCLTQPAALVALVALAIVLPLTRAVVQRWSATAAVLWAALAGLFSVAGLTCSKGLLGLWHIEPMRRLVGSGSAWLLLGLALTCSIVALVLLQVAFQKGRAVVVTPIFGAVSVVAPLAAGRLVFDERLDSQIGWPVALIATGVVALGLRHGRAGSR